MDNLLRLSVLILFVILFSSAVAGFDSNSDFIDFEGSSSWQFYSPVNGSFENPSNAVNLVAYGNSSNFESLLIESGWSYADGTDRYYFFDSSEEDNDAWVEESYQLEKGSYYSYRVHSRAYVNPFNDSVSVFQVHDEYWSWFSLRHEVLGINDARNIKADTFESQGFSIDRTYVGNESFLDSDGWIKTVSLALLVISLTSFSKLKNKLKTRKSYFEDQKRRYLLLLTIPTLIYISIRYFAVITDQTLDIHPYFITGFFYFCLVILLPLSIFYLSKSLEKFSVLVFVVLGLISGFILDYLLMNLIEIPLENILYKLSLALSLGIFGTGVAKSNSFTQDYAVVTGLSLYIVLLAVRALGVF